MINRGGKLLTLCYRSETKLGGLLLWDLLFGYANHDQPVPNAATEKEEHYTRDIFHLLIVIRTNKGQLVVTYGRLVKLIER